MKTLKPFFTSAFLLFSIFVYAQDSDANIGKAFIANESVIAYVYNEAAKKPETDRFILARNYRIKIIDRFNDGGISYYTVRVYNYFYGDDLILTDFASNKKMAATIKEDVSLAEETEFKRKVLAVTDKSDLQAYRNQFTGSSPLNDKIEVFAISKTVNGGIAYKLSKPQISDNIFLIKVNDLHSFRPYYEKREKFVNASYINIPAKIRFAPVDIVQNFNLGLNGDLKMRWGSSANSYVGLVFGINIAGTDFNEAEFEGLDSEDIKGSKLFTFSPNVGIYYQYKSIQFIIGSSMDYMSRNFGNDWCYQGKPNILFGVGTNLISNDKPTSSSIESKEIGKD